MSERTERRSLARSTASHQDLVNGTALLSALLDQDFARIDPNTVTYLQLSRDGYMTPGLPVGNRLWNRRNNFHC